MFCLATNQIAQTGLSSLPPVIYYSEQLFSQQLTNCLGLISSNHRMVFRRLNNDLYHVSWQFVSCQVGAQNEPWGWYLERI
ncbi:hypothetical protein E4184_00815 [Aeromonas media]|uniref:Uncharacterized protein n=1 Tax=Aeromonas media TaxID=651 RepID=A0A6M4Y5D4_AERME|nr:hypothetical protein E4184_00815 [Aeromonas media]